MTREGATLRLKELPINVLGIDRDGGEPIQQQIYKALRGLILDRTLLAGMQLPSTRGLAKDIGVARNTVMAAYEQLASEGYIETKRGSRPAVVDLPLLPSDTNTEELVRNDANLVRGGRSIRLSRPPTLFEGPVGFRPSTPDVKHFPFKTWRRLIVARYTSANADLLTYNHSAGLPSLRAAIANYIHAYRGVRCSPEEVVITNGAQGALDVIARLLLSEGDGVWMEEPGYHGAQGAFIAAGAVLSPLRVDEKGWQLEAPPSGDVRLIYTSPSCHFPLGLTMLMEQRLRLIEIARQKNAWIIEDDFDSEYHTSGVSVPAMQGVDANGRTIYVGTFAKTMFPSLRVGFMVLPKPINVDIVQALFVSGHFVGLPLQAALSDFICDGHFARHVRRMRKLYAERRERFLRLADLYLGEWIEPIQSNVGIQVTFRLKSDLDDQLIAQLASQRRLNVTPLSIHYTFGPNMRGFLLGYACLEDDDMEKYLKSFSEVFQAATGASR